MKMVGVLVVILILVLIRVFLSYFREKRLNKRRDQRVFSLTNPILKRPIGLSYNSSSDIDIEPNSNTSNSNNISTNFVDVKSEYEIIVTLINQNLQTRNPKLCLINTVWEEEEAGMDLEIPFKLNYFPTDVFKLTHLTQLTMGTSEGILLCGRVNSIPKIPFQIGCLINLERIDFGHNELKTLPDEFCSLKNLKTLYLHENKLEQLPHNFGSLIKLEKLVLYNNNLTSFPASMKDLLSLKELIIYGNRFTETPDFIFYLENLEVLDIHTVCEESDEEPVRNSDFQLTHFTENFKFLKKLKKIDLRGHNIGCKPDLGPLVEILL